MKIPKTLRRGSIVVTSFAVAIYSCFSSPAQAQDALYSQNFDGFADDETDLGDGTTINTNEEDVTVASVQGGALRLTVDGEGGTVSSFVIPSPGDEIADSFCIMFDVALGGGGARPADGFSVNVGQIADTDLGSGEGGFGTDLSVQFDTYDNGAENGFSSGIGVDINVDGANAEGGSVRERNTADPTDNRFYHFDGEFRPVEIYFADGQVTVILDGCPILENVAVPDFEPLTDDSVAFSARTGGAFEDVFIDNLVISAPAVLPLHDPKVEAPVSFSFEPTTLGESAVGVISVSNGGSDNPLVLVSGVLTGDTDSFALTTSFPVTIPPGDSADIGLEFSPEGEVGGRNASLVIETNDSYPKLQEVTIAIGGLGIPETLTAMAYDQNFDGFPNETDDLGDGSTIVSNNNVAFVVDGALQLTADGTGSSNAGFVIPTLGPVAAQSWQATFDVALNGGGTPADGFSFVFGPVAEGSTGSEEGFGVGLAVEFDTYNNGGEGAESGIGVDVSFDGLDAPDGIQRIDPAVESPNSNRFFKFDGVYRRYEITFEQIDGTTARVTVIIDGDVIHDAIEVPDIEPGFDWTFAFGARTGGATETVLIDNLRIIAPKPAEYTQTFNGFPDGTIDLEDGSALASSPANVTSVQMNALQLTVDGTASTTGNFRTPSLGVLATGSFSARFDLALSAGGNPADGFSFNFGTIPPALGGSEEGFGTGLAVEFDIWDNAGTDESEGDEIGVGVDVSVDGTTIAKNRLTAADDKKNNDFYKFDGVFRQVEIVWRKVDDEQSVIDVTIGGVFVFKGLEVSGFNPLPDDIFVFAGRTGGATETVLIDNLEIVAPAKPSTVRDPKIGGDRTVVLAASGGQTVEGVATVLNEGASKDLVLTAGTVAGANFEVTTTFPVSIPPGGSASIGVRFNAPAALGAVLGNLTLANNDSLESAREHVIRLEGLVVPAGVFEQNFDGLADDTTEFTDGSILLNNATGTARVFNNALIMTEDGVGSAQSSYKTPAMGPALAGGFTAMFDFSLEAAGQPADGFAFDYGNIAAGATAGEEGFGQGLTVSFDTWDNGGEGADTGIGMDIKVNGTIVPDGSIREALEFNDDGFNANSIFTFDGQFRTVTITWSPSPDGGFVTVSIGETILFEELPTPGFEPMPNFRFAWSARTGGAFETLILDNIFIAPGGPSQRLGLRFTNIEFDPATRNCTVTWASRPGKIYIIEAGGDLQLWEELQDGFESQGERTSFTEEGLSADTTERHYRVRVEE